MTEEDQLFIVLQRPSLAEIQQLHRDFVRNNAFTLEDQRNFFKSHGWTIQEYIRKLQNG